MANESRRGIGSVIQFIAGVIALIFIVHILLVLFDANAANSLATFFTNASDDLGAWFKDLFTPSSYKLRTFLNFGLAALFYLLIGRILAVLTNRI